MDWSALYTAHSAQEAKRQLAGPARDEWIAFGWDEDPRRSGDDMRDQHGMRAIVEAGWICDFPSALSLGTMVANMAAYGDYLYWFMRKVGPLLNKRYPAWRSDIEEIMPHILSIIVCSCPDDWSSFGRGCAFIRWCGYEPSEHLSEVSPCNSIEHHATDPKYMASLIEHVLPVFDANEAGRSWRQHIIKWHFRTEANLRLTCPLLAEYMARPFPARKRKCMPE